MTLNDLKQGESGIITKVKGRGAFRNRITEMGFVKGKKSTIREIHERLSDVNYKDLQKSIYKMVKKGKTNLMYIKQSNEKSLSIFLFSVTL